MRSSCARRMCATTPSVSCCSLGRSPVAREFWSASRTEATRIISGAMLTSVASPVNAPPSPWPTTQQRNEIPVASRTRGRANHTGPRCRHRRKDRHRQRDDQFRRRQSFRGEAQDPTATRRRRVRRTIASCTALVPSLTGNSQSAAEPSHRPAQARRAPRHRSGRIERTDDRVRDRGVAERGQHIRPARM